MKIKLDSFLLIILELLEMKECVSPQALTYFLTHTWAWID
jgi:hypothetical protein